MSATTAQLANLRNIRIAIVHAADNLESLLIDHSVKLTEDEAAAMYLELRDVYNKLDDTLDTLMVVEERDEG